MYSINKTAVLLAIGLSTAALAGCTPMLAGQMAEAGYNAAKSSLGGAGDSAVGADQRQKRLQSVLNSVEIGQEVQPILDLMGEPPKEKSGNAYGFTCYEYASVYSAAEAAILMSKEGKVVFFGNSRCSIEMQDVNFKKDGKYMASGLPG